MSFAIRPIRPADDFQRAGRLNIEDGIAVNEDAPLVDGEVARDIEQQIIERLTLESTALAAIAGREAQGPKFTTGHCENKRKPGGCQLHNLHCGYPKCDQRPVAALPHPQPDTGGRDFREEIGHDGKPTGYLLFTPPPPSDAAQGVQAVRVDCQHVNDVLGADGVRFCNVCGAHKGEGNGC